MNYDFQPTTEFEFKKTYHRATEAVRLVGTGLCDKSERLKRLIAVTVIYSEGGATQPFEYRLEEIASIPSGWYDGENSAPTPAAVGAMRQFLEDVSLLSSPLPHLYPIPSGGVVAEWSLGYREASAEIDPSGDQLGLNAVNTVTADELDMLIALNSPNLMREFKSFMSTISSEEDRPMPVDSQYRLPTSDELLMRQVHPSQITEKRPSSRCFTSTGTDKGHLSADRESLLSPREAYEQYLQRKQLSEGGGTWGVSIAEFGQLGLLSCSDPLSENESHALVDFTSAGENKKQLTKGKLAYAKAIARKRLHPLSAADL
ncbi:hypothetical protein [Comamonas endophytica]|uniref:Uncharacterized protein n=1 Tax=Comamonas endophytica TaxID=2949090 RepID=A0ABY6G7H0_9BURK|nr:MULTISPECIES: hypothetical protein [unclassified Acidovorax]MCD2511467.1 hypothetical protein [Acidovorax sp. D4N7]UYG50858.1 hypothetical protein M9799_12235 [Acidovorax sp. 5MLIR]